MKISIKKQLEEAPQWQEVEKVISRLHQKGFEVFVVGGAVRDALLKKEVMDIDLVSSAKAREILSLFPKAKDFFAKYGVVFIPLKNKHNLQITTFRTDSPSSDGRRPQSIQYSSIKEDAKRRDFTINALFYNLNTDQVQDFATGLKDLKDKKIKTIGKAKDRFKEDYLRILRALRLAHQLDFKIDPQIKKSSSELADEFKKHISKNKIVEEINKMLVCGKIDSIIIQLKNYKLLPVIFPLLKFKKSNLKKYLLFYQQRFSFYKEPAFCWTVLALPFFYQDKKAFSIFLKDHPLPNSLVKQALSYWTSVKISTDPEKSFTDKITAFDKKPKQVYQLTQALLNAGIIEKEPTAVDTLKKDLKFYFKEFNKRAEKDKLPSALLTGSDLLKIQPSIPKQSFSRILKKAYDCQIEQPQFNKKQILKKVIKMLKN